MVFDTADYMAGWQARGLWLRDKGHGRREEGALFYPSFHCNNAYAVVVCVLTGLGQSSASAVQAACSGSIAPRCVLYAASVLCRSSPLAASPERHPSPLWLLTADSCRKLEAISISTARVKQLYLHMFQQQVL